MIRSFHEGMQGTVQYDGNYSKPFEILSGVKQGCVFALMLKTAFGNCTGPGLMVSMYCMGVCQQRVCCLFVDEIGCCPCSSIPLYSRKDVLRRFEGMSRGSPLFKVSSGAGVSNMSVYYS